MECSGSEEFRTTGLQKVFQLQSKAPYLHLVRADLTSGVSVVLAIWLPKDAHPYFS